MAASMKREVVHYGPENRHSGLLVFPVRAPAPLPTVIVIQEAWGVDAHIEDVAERFAKAGYLALAPDLYTDRGTRPPALSHDRIEKAKDASTKMPPAAWRDSKARDEFLTTLFADAKERTAIDESISTIMTCAMVQIDSFVPQLVEAVKFVKTHPMNGGAKIGSVGFCMGGGLSVRLACAEPSLAAAIIYYGTSPSPIERVATINCPVLGLYGGLDERVNGGIPELAATLTKHGKKFEHHIYEGAQHAFNNDTAPRYHVKAAREAWARALEFFRVNLQ